MVIAAIHQHLADALVAHLAEGDYGDLRPMRCRPSSTQKSSRSDCANFNIFMAEIRDTTLTRMCARGSPRDRKTVLGGVQTLAVERGAVRYSPSGSNPFGRHDGWSGTVLIARARRPGAAARSIARGRRCMSGSRQSSAVQSQHPRWCRTRAHDRVIDDGGGEATTAPARTGAEGGGRYLPAESGNPCDRQNDPGNQNPRQE